MHDYSDYGINLNGKKAGADGEISTLCPQCSHTRSAAGQKKPCLRVNVNKGTWCCMHPTCGWKGGLGTGAPSHQPSRPERRPVFPVPDPTRNEKLIEWFHSRGISAEVVAAHAISSVTRYYAATGDVDSIAFPYYFNGEVVNFKYRSLEGKHFSQEKGGLKVLYGIDGLRDGNGTAVIVEGECDVLAIASAGISGAVSVPDGAPAQGAKCSDLKFEYLQTCKAQLDKLTKIIIAVDNDAPGKTLEAELIRRLGPDRCWRVTWPADCKDANDVLLKHGTEELRRCVDAAKPVPVAGLVEVADVVDDLLLLRQQGLPKGISTGWSNVDDCYTVKPGEFTVITGIPGHGKSEFLDALSVNLATHHGWRFGVCSPENMPVQRHLAKLAEKYVGYPFGSMSTASVATAVEWMNTHYYFIVPDDSLTIPELLKKSSALVQRYGINGLIVDPWNEFDHRRSGGMNETEYVSYALSQIRQWARKYAVHVWLVAHPQKLYRRDDGSFPVPGMWDISGSAHFRNKADNGLCVWRDVMDQQSGKVDIHVQKIRFREVGKVGKVALRWSAIHGRYENA